MVMQQPTISLNNQKGESYAVNDCCGTGNFVAPGVGDQLHNGRVHSRQVPNQPKNYQRQAKGEKYDSSEHE